MNQELKPMDLGTIFDRTFRLGFSNLKNYLKIYPFMFISTVAVNFFSNYFSTGSMNLNFLKANPALIASSYLYAFLRFFLEIIFICMALDLFSKSFMEEDWTFGESFKFVIRKFFIIIPVTFLSILIIIFGFLLLIIGAFVLAIFLSFTYLVILNENKKTIESINRSFSLVGYNFWGIMGTILLFGLIYLGMSLIFGILVTTFFTIGNRFDSSITQASFWTIFNISSFSSTKIIFGILYLIVYFFFQLIVTGISYSFLVILFFNQKITFENFGVEILAASMINEDSREPKYNGSDK